MVTFRRGSKRGAGTAEAAVLCLLLFGFAFGSPARSLRPQMVKWGQPKDQKVTSLAVQANKATAVWLSQPQRRGAMMTVAGFGIPLVASPIHGGQLSTVIEGERNKGKDEGKCIPSADFHGGRYPASCVNSTYAHPFL